MKIIGTLMLAAALSVGTAFAWERTDSIHPSLPPVTIRVTDAGQSGDALRENLLRAEIAATDGSCAQTIEWKSMETSAHDGAAALVMLRDVNFDGYNDLMLLTAQGARNVFHALSVYHPEERCFMPVMQGSAWSTQEKAFSWESIQLELCNTELHPDERRLLSSVADGYRFQTEIIYEWEGITGLAPKSVVDVYDAGEGQIGELLYLYATGITRCWDAAYPEEWYYGQEGVFQERLSSCRALTLTRALSDPELARVSNVDWVNLRQRDSKASPSLAKLDAGTEVCVLARGLGTDKGWVRVYMQPEGDEVGLTGYIWHRYLERVSP